MNNNVVNIFISIYENCSISKAAKDLFFSKQTISKALMSLEKEIGSKLFNRNSNGLVPTEEAHTLYTILKYLKKNIDNISEFYKIKNNPYSVRIVDNNFESITRIFNKAIDLYSDDSILYSFENQDSQEVYNMLIKDQVDIGIFAIPKDLEDEVRKSCEKNNINIELLVETGPSIVVSKKHPLAKLDIIRASDLTGYDRIDLIRSTERLWYFNNYLRANGIEIEAKMKTNAIANIITSLKLLDYYFISIYSKAEQNLLGELRMIPFQDTGLDILIILGYKRDAYYDKVSTYFMNLVRKHYKGEKIEDWILIWYFSN